MRGIAEGVIVVGFGGVGECLELLIGLIHTV